MSESRFNGKTGEMIRWILTMAFGALVSYFAAMSALKQQIADTNQRVSIVETKEDLHYQEVQRTLLRIEQFMEHIEATGQDRRTGEPYSLQRQIER